MNPIDPLELTLMLLGSGLFIILTVLSVTKRDITNKAAPTGLADVPDAEIARIMVQYRLDPLTAHRLAPQLRVEEERIRAAIRGKQTRARVCVTFAIIFGLLGLLVALAGSPHGAVVFLIIASVFGLSSDSRTGTAIGAAALGGALAEGMLARADAAQAQAEATNRLAAQRARL